MAGMGRFVLYLLALVAVACGARTGDEFLDADGGIGFGGSSAIGGVSGKGGTVGGRGGVGGIGGTVAGSGGAFCVSPACDCGGDCFSTCLCVTQDSNLCSGACFGAGGVGGIAGAGGVGGVGGFPGDCCFGHSFAGCQDPGVASCVCSFDPYCCNSLWDETCVREVSQTGCGFCGVGGSGGIGGTGGLPGVVCGTSLCTPTSAGGFTFPACCPSSNPSVCGSDMSQVAGIVPLPPGCVERNQPGSFDPTCPSTTISVAGITLSGCCKPGGVCGNDFSIVGLGCVFTAPYGGPPFTPCGGGVGGVGGVGGTGGSGGSTGDCCSAHSWPGCGDLAVSNCVCASDPFCCQTSWDNICAGDVSRFGCGTCSGTGGTGGVGGSGGTGGVGGSGAFGGTSTGGAGGSTGGAGGSGGVGQCIVEAQNQCEVCMCQNCFSEFGACLADFGCPVILQCVADTGCRGSACYQPNTCQAVIDSFGGPGSTSTQLAGQLYQCILNTGCPCL